MALERGPQYRKFESYVAPGPKKTVYGQDARTRLDTLAILEERHRSQKELFERSKSKPTPKTEQLEFDI